MELRFFNGITILFSAYSFADDKHRLYLIAVATCDQYADIRRRQDADKFGPLGLDPNDENAPDYIKDPLNHSPMSSSYVPAFDRIGLLDFEAVLNEDAVYDEFKKWLWRVWEECKKRSVKKNLHRIVCNAIFCRFDCVLLLIGTHQSSKKPITKKQQQQGRYKMVSFCKLLH